MQNLGQSLTGVGHKMEGLDYWRLCDELSVTQAALLIVGIDPSSEASYARDWRPHERPQGYDAASTALINAILDGRLPATIRRKAWERGWEEVPSEGEKLSTNVKLFQDQSELHEEAEHGVPREIIYRAEPDWDLTTIRVDDLQKWLAGRGFKAGFFFPLATDIPDFLDPRNPFYAPKLAAAIRAWQAVSGDPKLMRGKTPKQAMMEWLRRNADRFGLTKDDGNPNDQGIEEVAKIANWDRKGGAPKTPGN